MHKRVEGSNETDYEEAVRAMQFGDKKVKTKIAFFKLAGQGGSDFDAEGAIHLLNERVGDGDCNAMWMLGLCCEYGMGTEQDIEQAELLYEQSVEAGSAIGRLLKENDEEGRGRGVLNMSGKFVLPQNGIMPSLKTDSLTHLMKTVFGTVITIAPWTTLDLDC